MTSILSRTEIVRLRSENEARTALRNWCPACEREVDRDGRRSDPVFASDVHDECASPLTNPPPVADPRWLEACEIAHDMADALDGKHMDDCPFRENRRAYCHCQQVVKDRALARFHSALSQEAPCT